MTISIRLSPAEAELIKSYAILKNQSVSDVMRKAILEQIEDEYDLEVYEKAMAEYRKNPVTYSLEEVEKELGLS
ncbi:MAG: type II toxin-antitoxin system RelB family antitoxin [Desulfitobacterium sp.]